jgi:hypothetical protein
MGVVYRTSCGGNPVPFPDRLIYLAHSVLLSTVSVLVF